MSHVKHVNESRHTFERVTSHMSMSRITHVNESRHTQILGIDKYTELRLALGRKSQKSLHCATELAIPNDCKKFTKLLYRAAKSTTHNDLKDHF